jgi:hypothetical protein
MNSPFTDQAQTAFTTAQWALGVVSAAVFASRSAKARGALVTALLIASQWAAIESDEAAAFMHAMAPGSDVTALHMLLVSRIAALAAAVLSLLPQRIGSALGAAAGFAVCHFAANLVTDSAWEIAALHTLFAPLVFGLSAARDHAVTGLAKVFNADKAERFDDFILAASAFSVGALVAKFVLVDSVDSSDEWGYTYQAAAFAKGRLYGAVPPCIETLRNFWIFWREGRMFAQYQPGWPLAFAPLFWLKAEHLAGAASFAFLIVPIARLGRRVGTAHGQRRTGGFIAGGLVLFGNTLMINAGSRFPHLFVCGLWAWALHGVASAVDHHQDARRGRRGALVLGTALGFLALTRAPEAVFFGTPIAAFALFALVRRKLRASQALWAMLPAMLGCLILLGISRAQVGKWFTLPYQIATEFHPWVVLKFSLPPLNMLKWPLPLATGTYCFWPLAPGLGLAGIAILARSAERRLAFLSCAGSAIALTYYGLLEFGRGWDFGYGPRYQMHVILPIALGSTAVLLPILRAPNAARAVIVTAMAIGVVRIAFVTFPFNHDLLVRNDAPMRAAKTQNIHNAIVHIRNGTWVYGTMDATRNLPIELYNPDVIYIGESNAQGLQCMREHFGARTLYQTVKKDARDVTLQAVPVP